METNTMNTLFTASAKNRTSILARLLATENLTVVHSREAQSAAFDLKTRTLILPMWKTDKQSVYDFLVGHEVGHAKFTPADKWREGAERIAGTRGEEAARVAQDYINVVEDARIERAIKREFPGLRRDFIDGYNTLNEMDIFNLKGRDLRSLPLIDRLNLHFKIGIHCGVTIPFSREELSFVDRIGEARTWDEVVQIAGELFEREASKQRNQQGKGEGNSGGKGEKREGQRSKSQSNSDSEQQDSEEGQGSEGDGSEGDGSESGKDQREGEDGDEAESEANGNGAPQDGDEGEDGEDGPKGECQGSSSTTESREDDTDDGESAESVKVAPSAGQPNDRVPAGSETMESMREGMKKFVDNNTDEVPVKIAIPLPERITIGVDQFVSTFDSKVGPSRYNSDLARRFESEGPVAVIDSLAKEEFKQFEKESRKAVDLLCRRFEVRRAARNFRREGSAKSGRISIRDLSKYKFSEDIFSRLTIRPDEKNHGIVILLDWSGSMSGMLHDTVTQLVTLLLFCRRCGIPAEVYFFSTVLVPEMERRFEEKYGKEYNGAPLSREDLMGYSATHACGWSLDAESYEFTDWVCGLADGTTKRGQAVALKPFSLVKIYEQGMNNAKFMKVIGRFLLLANTISYRRGALVDMKSRHFELGDTPLDESILAMTLICQNFRKSNNTKITMISLSDGDGATIGIRQREQMLDDRYEKQDNGLTRRIRAIRVLIDPINGRRYRDTIEPSLGSTQGIVTSIFREHSGCELVGMMMVGGSSVESAGVERTSAFNRVKDSIMDYDACRKKGEEMVKEFQANKFLSLDIFSYSKYFVVFVQSNRGIDREAQKEMKRLERMKNQKVAVTRAFIANQKREDLNRMFVNRLMEVIA